LRSPEQKTLPVTRTAHYATYGTPGPHIKRFILACHGYGQVCEKFILDLEPLADEETYIVAPEGLSTFYWGGFDGPTVSSWMTRRHRLDEIEDFSHYLGKLFHQSLRALSGSADPHAPVQRPLTILFGFSQGCATIMRWVMRAFPEEVDRMIFWAGSIPEDLDYLPHLDYFKKRKLLHAVGREDPFLTPDRIDWHTQMLTEKQLPVEQIPFEGKHDIPEGALLKIVG